MKVRAYVIAAALGAAALVSGARDAQAQGPARQVSPPVTQAVDVIDAGRFFTSGAGLGDAWSRALHSVLDGMRRTVEEERLAAHKVVSAELPARLSAAPNWRMVLPPAVRDVVATVPVQVAPVPASPPTESVRDVRGERSVLLGARVELPWIVP